MSMFLLTSPLMYCRCVHAWLDFTKRRLEARSMVAAFRIKQQQALERHLLLAWFSHSKATAAERKAQVPSQLFPPISPATSAASICPCAVHSW